MHKEVENYCHSCLECQQSAPKPNFHCPSIPLPIIESAHKCFIRPLTRMAATLSLFSIREVPQASTGFSPFERLYPYKPRGLLDVAKEAWEEQPCPHRSKSSVSNRHNFHRQRIRVCLVALESFESICVNNSIIIQCNASQIMMEDAALIALNILMR